MTYKKYTFCLAFLLLFNAGSTLNGSENSVSTKTMVITTGAFLFGGLLLWKRAYIAHYFLSKIFKSNNVDKKITLSSDIHHIKDTTGVQKAIVISSDKDHTSNNISVLSSIIVPSLNYDLPEACEAGDIETVKILLCNPDIDPNKKYPGGDNTILHMACRKNNEKIVQLLLTHPKIDINISNSEYLSETPLYIACSKNYEKIVALLLNDKRIDPNFISDKLSYLDFLAPLHIACKKNYPHIVQLLLNHDDIDPNVRTSKYQTSPLSIAIKTEHIAIIRLLLNHPKIDPNELINAYLDSAFEYNNIEIAKLILDHPKTNRDKIDFCSFFSSSYSRMKFIRLLLSYPEIDLNVCAKYTHGDRTDTPLAWVCKKKNIRMINLLLAHPSTDPNAPRGDGQTPLMISLGLKTKKITKLLLNDPRTNPNKGGAKGEKPLIATIKYGDTQQIKLLLNHPQVKNALKNNEYSPEECNDAFLYYCGRCQEYINIDIASQIFDALNIDLKMCDTALHAACDSENLNLLRFLLTKEPDVHVKNNQGLTPLVIASNKNSVVYSFYLCTPDKSNLAMIKLLLEYGACLSDEDECHKDVVYNAYTILTDQEFVHSDPKEFFTNELHKACSIIDNGVIQKSFIQWCQDKGADINARNGNNERAVDIIGKEFHLMQKLVPFHSADLIHKEKMYHHLLRITPYYPDEKLYVALKTNFLNADISKRIMAYYKILTLDRDIAQQADYKYEKMSNMQKNRFKKNFFTTTYKGLLPCLSPVEQLSFGL